MVDLNEYKLLIIGSVVKGATSAVVKKYVDKVVNPFLRGLSNLKSGNAIKNNIFRYVKSVECRTRTLPSIAIPSGVFQLENVYEPLTVRSENDGASYLVDSYPRELFGHSRCIALTDDAGMGKSTLAKFIVRSALNEHKNIPLFVELRRIRSGGKILESLCQELAGGSSASAAGIELINLMESGNFLFVLDGYDELEDEVRSEVTEEINSIAARFKFCYFLLTSRREYGSSLFPEFAHFEICKLNEEQAYSLINRYDQGRGLAKALINKISEVDVEEFLGNPLLVTLLYKAFDYRQSIPPKRGIFFRQVYDALFQDHDLSKGASYERPKQCGLDVDDFHKFLRSLGFITFKSGRVSYSTEEFCAHLQAAVERSSLNVDWQKIKLDLVKAVPIFIKDGVEFRWSHKAFQEYFTAQYVAVDLASRREEAVKKIFCSDDVVRFREVLRFIAEADVALVREICIEPLLSEVHGSSMSDTEFSEAVIFNSADVFYVGDFDLGGGHSQVRSSLQKIVESRLGINTSNQLTRSFVRLNGSYAVLVALKAQGFRFFMLPLLDSENFQKLKRLEDMALYKHWHKLFGKSTTHINPDLSTQRSSIDIPDGIKSLAAVTQIPVVTKTIHDRIAADNVKRKKAIELSVLDGF